MENTKLPDFKEEKKLWKAGFNLVIGVDEVGRGAFAGPLVAAAVVWQRNQNFKFQISNFKLRIDDSKRMKPNERKKSALWIKKNCLAYGIGKVGVATINRIGIGKATERAMRRAIGELLKKFGWEVRSELRSENEDENKLRLTSHIVPPFLLVDAFHIKYLRGIGLKNQKAIKKGDQKSISIAAASILAKVFRDSLMQSLTKRYSQYRWGQNKGYGTKIHQQAIVRYGITRLHRRRFVETFLGRSLPSRLRHSAF